MASNVVTDWMEQKDVMNRAGVGKLTLCSSKKGLSRGDVVNNGPILIPILKHIGARPSLEQLVLHVERLFVLARPVGKPPINRFLEALETLL